MAAILQLPSEAEHQPAAPLFSVAFLCSVALHVMAGGLLLPSWMKADEKPVPPLMVTLEASTAVPAQTPAAAPEAHQHPHVRRVPDRQTLPVTPVQHAPAPSPLTVETRAEPATLAQPAVTPAPPVPVVVAVAPASVTPAGKPQPAAAHVDVAYLIKPQPAYPSMARRLGIEGLVMVRVQVSATGVPEQVSVAQSSGTNALDEEAMRAVRESRFEPARRGEVAYAHVVEVPIRFRLRN
jgi:protein TonB